MNRRIRLPVIFTLMLLFSTIKLYADNYGSYGNLVYRADSSGNTVWVKNFNGRILPIPSLGNLVYGSAFDGKYVHVLIDQVDTGSSGGPLHYVSTVVLDTNGNTVTSQTRMRSSSNFYQLGTILPSFSNGAWYTELFASWSNRATYITKIDSLGDDVLSVSSWFSTMSEINDFIELKDSTFLVASFNYELGGPTTSAISLLMKFDDNGNIIWAYDYNIPISDALHFMSCTEDDHGNIYSIGFYNVSGSNNVVFGLKVDSAGTPILFRTWNSLNINYHKLSFRNNEIIDFYQGQEIHFDSLFQDSCLTSSLDSVSFTPTLPVPSSVGTSFTTSFLPSDTTLTLFANTYPDYCSTLLSIDEIQSDQILIYPNPAGNKIQFNLNNASNLSIEVIIYDAVGSTVYTNRYATLESVDVSHLTDGLYFLRLKTGEVVQSGKFVKQ